MERLSLIVTLRWLRPCWIAGAHLTGRQVGETDGPRPETIPLIGEEAKLTYIVLGSRIERSRNRGSLLP